MGKKSQSTSDPFAGISCVKIVGGFKPGDVVFIESDRMLSQQQMQHINTQFKQMVPDLRVVVLQGGLRVMGSGPDETCPGCTGPLPAEKFWRDNVGFCSENCRREAGKTSE